MEHEEENTRQYPCFFTINKSLLTSKIIIFLETFSHPSTCPVLKPLAQPSTCLSYQVSVINIDLTRNCLLKIMKNKYNNNN